MNNYSINGISIAAMMDTRTINSEGKYPVRIRVNYQRKRKYIPTGKSNKRGVAIFAQYTFKSFK